MPEQGKLAGYVIVHVKPFEGAETRRLVITGGSFHPAPGLAEGLGVMEGSGIYGATERDKAERRARELQDWFKDPWYQVAELRLQPEPATQVKTNWPEFDKKPETPVQGGSDEAPDLLPIGTHVRTYLLGGRGATGDGVIVAYSEVKEGGFWRSRYGQSLSGPYVVKMDKGEATMGAGPREVEPLPGPERT